MAAKMELAKHFLLDGTLEQKFQLLLNRITILGLVEHPTNVEKMLILFEHPDAVDGHIYDGDSKGNITEVK
jgi:hypothetical protein